MKRDGSIQDNEDTGFKQRIFFHWGGGGGGRGGQWRGEGGLRAMHYSNRHACAMFYIWGCRFQVLKHLEFNIHVS